MDTSLTLPDLPEGLRWVIEEDRFGDVIVKLQKRMTKTTRKWFRVVENLFWETVGKADATLYGVYETKDLPHKIQTTAVSVLRTYNSNIEKEALRKSLIGVYNDYSPRDDL